MSSDKAERQDWRRRVRDIVDSAARIWEYAGSSDLEHLAADRKTLAAVCWEFAVIGEAVRHVPDDVQARFPEVPWAEMRGMRNAIVHGYDTVDLAILWDTIAVDLPAVVPLLQSVLATGTAKP